MAEKALPAPHFLFPKDLSCAWSSGIAHLGQPPQHRHLLLPQGTQAGFPVSGWGWPHTMGRGTATLGALLSSLWCLDGATWERRNDMPPPYWGSSWQCPDPAWAELRQPCWDAPHLNVPSRGYFSGYACVCLADIPLGMGVFPPQDVQAFGAFLFALEVEYPGTPAIVQGLA